MKFQIEDFRKKAEVHNKLKVKRNGLDKKINTRFQEEKKYPEM